MHARQIIQICIFSVLFLHKTKLAVIKNDVKRISRSTDEDMHENLAGREERAVISPLYDVTYHNSCPPSGSLYEKFNKQYYSCPDPYVYHCRLNEKYKFVDGCAVEHNCNSGTEAILHPIMIREHYYTARCDVCREGYYNDKNHSSTNETKCEKIQSCVRDYIICSNGTASSNARCTCDYRKRFRPKKKTHYCPPVGKAECESHNCPKGKILDGPPQFQCIDDETLTTTTKKPEISEEPDNTITKVPDKPVVTNISLVTSGGTAKTTTVKATTVETTRSPEDNTITKVPDKPVVTNISLVTSGGTAKTTTVKATTVETTRSPEGEGLTTEWIIIIISIIVLVIIVFGIIFGIWRMRKGRKERKRSSNGSQSQIPMSSLTEPSTSDSGGSLHSAETIDDPVPEQSGNDEKSIERNREILQSDPEICGMILDKVKCNVDDYVDPSVYLDTFYSLYALKTSKTEKSILDEINDMRSKGHLDKKLINRILGMAKKTGVEGYFRFKYTLQKAEIQHLLDIVEIEEESITEEKQKNNMIQDDELDDGTEDEDTENLPLMSSSNTSQSS